MNSRKFVATSLVALSTAAAAPGLHAQTTPSPASTPDQSAAATTPEDETIMLSPFVVEGSEEKGTYLGTSTLAATRIRTDLKDVGSAVQVVTSQFLQDTGVTKAEDLLVYTTNTEVGGAGGNFLGAGNGAQISTANVRANPSSDTRVRGLTAADNTRDFFLTDIPWDSYNVDRVELQRGPNSILFGLGSPAGIINTSVRGASFEPGGSIEGRYGSYGSWRGSIDYNAVLSKDQLAVRFDAVDDLEHYRQAPAFNRDQREFASLRFDPAALNKGEAHTSLHLNFENGRIQANNPDPTPPIDAITPWFAMGKPAYDSTLSWASTLDTVNANPGTGAGVLNRTVTDSEGNVVASPNYNPWIGNFGRIYDNAVFLYGDPNATTPGGAGFPAAITGTNKPLSAPGQSIASLPAASMVGVLTYDQYATNANLPGSTLGVYKAKSLTDPSIFNFRDNLLGGPNDRQLQDWQNFSGDLSETFWKDHAGIDLAYNHEHYNQSQEYQFQGFANALTVDINTTLPDGSPNPNFGRPAVASDSGYNSATENTRSAYRLTGFGEFNFADFMDRSNWLTQLLGQHTLTAFYGHDTHDVFTTDWTRYATDDVYGNLIATSGVLSPNRVAATVSYLGPTLSSAASAADANISRVAAIQQPMSTTDFRSFNSTYSSTLDPNGAWTDPATGQVLTNKDNPANYPGWQTGPLTIWNADQGNRNLLYTGANKTKSVDDAYALIWQGHLWNDTLVGTVGYRHDSADYYSAGTVPNNPNGTANPFAPDWVLPNDPNNTVAGHTTSWSVVAHTPQFLRDRLPGHTDVSLFYNDSKNFNPDPTRTGIYGESLPAPQGQTRDYGVMLSTLDDRLTFRITRYRTTVTDQTLPGGVPGGFYMIGDSEAWGYLFAEQALNHYGAFAQDYTPGPGQTQADATAEENLAVSTFLAGLQPDSFWQSQQITGGTPANALATNAWQGWMQANGNPSLAITGDTLSTGTEYEITGRPTDNWNISVNAAQTHATQINLAQSVADWIEARHAFFQGPAGLVREWNNSYSPSETLRQKFDSNTYAAYELIKLQEGGDVPELRPWRFNLVTSYNFTDGSLKGWNVGGAYRWQDRQVVGYALTADDSAVDITKPYKSPSVSNIDLWVGYQFRWEDKVTNRIQLNVKNLFANNNLIPVSVEPDGTTGQARIPESTTFSLTDSVSF